jgi:dienelactone hydrolase
MVQRRYLTLLILLIIFSGSTYAAALLDTDMGNVSREDVTIAGPGYSIRGTLYTPKGLVGKTPALALVHGVSNSREVFSGVALELARNGYVALTIDEKGHGESDPGVGVTDPTLGLGSAVAYLASLPYVDANRIGMGGHSMGAGAVRAVVSADAKIATTILIGGGTDDSEIYPPLTTTSPKNLLFIVGRNDVLFDLDSLDANLRPAFGTTEAIVPGAVYGEFGDGTARKLVVLEAIHLVEPLDPATAREIVEWANRSLKPHISYPMPVKPQTYLVREALMGVSLIAFVAAVVPISQVVNDLIPGRPIESPQVRHRFLRERSVLLLWSLLGLVLYLPAMFLGTIITFPPLIFGSSMAWWLLTTGVVGLVILLVAASRQPKGNVDILRYLRESFRVRDTALGLVVAGILYAMAYASYALFTEKIRFIVPIFPPLTPSRAGVFPLFIPFYLIYFVSEGLYLHVYRQRQMAGSAAGNAARTILLKLAPYLALLKIQYLPMFALNYRLLPGFLGFFIEFIWAIIPLFVISTFVSWWSYRFTGRIWAGVLLNAILFAWASAGLFPFTAFR